MSFATLDDLKSRWPATGPPLPADDVLEQALDDAELAIRARWIEIDWALAELYPDFGDIPLQTVILVETRVAIRALTQPSDRPIIRQQVGDTSVAYEPGGTTGFGLDDTDAELLKHWFQSGYHGDWGAA